MTKPTVTTEDVVRWIEKRTIGLEIERGLIEFDVDLIAGAETQSDEWGWAIDEKDLGEKLTRVFERVAPGRLAAVEVVEGFADESTSYWIRVEVRGFQ